MKLNLDKNIPTKPVDAFLDTRNKKKQRYLNPVGWWEVTTEGDCEGRTVNNLGVYYGHVAEIAFNLADICNYSLQFNKPINEISAPQVYPSYQAKSKQVNVNFSIESGTWPSDMDIQARVNHFKKILNTDEIEVKEGEFYACVKLVLK